MRRMYSKKQLEELISEMSGDILKVTNVKQLNDEQCNGLKVGDIVAKKTGKQYHCYIVTYKQDKHGLCLSYFDASVVETQSYDYTAGHWVYNSEDKTEFSSLGHTDTEIKALAKEEVEGAESGTIADSLGLDSEGNLVKGAVSSGSKYYQHQLRVKITTAVSGCIYFRFILISSSHTEVTSKASLTNLLYATFGITTAGNKKIPLEIMASDSDDAIQRDVVNTYLLLNKDTESYNEIRFGRLISNSITNLTTAFLTNFSEVSDIVTEL